MPIRTVLTNIGSMGNVQPFLALAHELRRFEFEPVLALAPQYATYVRSLGFEFVPIGQDLDYAALQRRDTESALRGRNPLQMMYESLAIVEPMMRQMFDEMAAVCEHAGLLISGHLQPVSRMVHELTGIPFVSIHTNHFGQSQPASFRNALCSIVNPLRKQLGLTPLTDPMHTDANSPQLALYAMSKYLRAPSPGWPRHFHVTGFFYLEDDQWTPPGVLVDFLKEGPPPVVFSFSSIAHQNPEAVTDTLLEAIDRVSCRAIIQNGWSGLAKDRRLPSNVLSIGFVQHTWLLPKASCVVHASGSGTQASTLRSGVPAVIVPHIGDQPLWAELARGLGCAKAIIPYGELTADSLAHALEETLTDRELYAKAKLIAQKVNAEQGVTRARRLITDLLLQLGVVSEEIAREPIEQVF
jgi:sterol 3beta-glucosyltransferase